jgi:NAD(P)-dependent dehydrogenase (short-subunit alcohol dehydrogenase family)
MKTVFISGAHQGIGKALAESCLQRGDTVYGIGEAIDKSMLSHSAFYYREVDYYSPGLLQDYLREFVSRHTFDRVILAHDAYGKIEDISEQVLETMRKIMNVNLWSTKHTIDAIVRNAKVYQIVTIGANLEQFTHRGWSAYVLSKTAQHALMPFYANEFPQTHFSTIIPSITLTPELSQIFQTTNARRFPSVARIQSGLIKSPEQSAEALIDGCAQVLSYRSGETFMLNELIR